VRSARGMRRAERTAHLRFSAMLFAPR